jgi:hypothetical protein
MAREKFEELDRLDQERLLNRDLLVIEMREESPNEARDLFIRLQSGTPLTAQQKRDAYPGDFSLFVIRHAGKSRHKMSNPKQFFELVPRGRKLQIDDDSDSDSYVDKLADNRKFFAGLAMTIMVRERSGEDFVFLKGKTINEFYIENLELKPNDPAAIRVLKVLDFIPELPSFADLTSQRPMTRQMAFHLALIIDSLLAGNYVPIWKQDVIKAFMKFQVDVAEAHLHHKQTGEAKPHYERFKVLLGGSGSDTAEVIRRRHNFFTERMYSEMRLKPLDGQRLFDTLEKEIIWNRDGRKCLCCELPVKFREIHIHHVVEHIAGGRTIFNNGVTVCVDCHTDRKKMQELAPKFGEHLERVSNSVRANEFV